MPVRFETTSEYQQRFAGYNEPQQSTNQPRTSAGLRSEQIGIVNDPPIQRKKRCSSADHGVRFFDDQAPRPTDDYILLGDQHKFANSIRYRTKSRERVAPQETKKSFENGSNNNAVNGAELLSPPPAPRPQPKSLPPKPKPAQKVERPSRPRHRTEHHHVPAVKYKDAAVETDLNEAPRPSALKKSTSAPILKAAADRQHKAVPQESTAEPNISKKGPKDVRDKRKGNMNEFVQTDLDRGVTDSGQEAPQNYAMMYRAGVAPPRNKGPKRLSEYDAQYQWKEGVGSSPLLAAQQLIYENDPVLGPYKAKMPRSTEYAAKFKKWQPTKGVAEPQLSAGKSSNMQRSKSMGSLTPEKRQPAGIDREIDEDNKRLLKESMNPLHIHFPHGKQKAFRSEYAMNFQAPQKYRYEEGAWRGANPPHLNGAPQLTTDTLSPVPIAETPEVTSQPPPPPNVPKVTPQLSKLTYKDSARMASDPPSSATSWYSEVMELRQKAREYKLRSRGTHFSREHLAQLYAKQAELWDAVSNSSTLSALSLESGAALHQKNRTEKSDPSKNVAGGPKKVWDEISVLSRTESHVSSNSKASTSSAAHQPVSSAPTNESVAGSSRASTLTPTALQDDDDEGRVPTPTLKATKPKQRHHLDRTTPAVGGALLVSPQRQKSSKERVAGWIAGQVEENEQTAHRTSSAPVLTSEETRHKPAQASSSWNGPALGMPTRDTHFLVDEEASTDRPIETQYTRSPPIHNQNHTKRKQLANIPTTIKETLREELTASNLSKLPGHERPAPEEDVLSISARSVASSCSLASEVLERARQRRDNFWGKPH